MNLERHTDIEPGLFYRPQTAAERRDLFAKYVRNITLELFDYCNRQCSYCPVSLIDRRSQVKLMERERFLAILGALEEISFAGSVCLNLFNEPLAHERTYEAIDEITAALPHARVWFNTNGDYLNRKVLQRLQKAGLKRMVVTLHVAPEDTYEDLQQLTRINQLAARTGLGFQLERYRPGTDIRASARSRGLEVTVKSVNYGEHGVNRGGALEHIPVKKERMSPCDRPFHDLTIAWNGNVYPCCQFVDGFADHAQYIVGTIATRDDVFDLYASEMMTSFRNDVFGYGAKRSPCDSCADQDKCRGAADKQRRTDYQAQAQTV